MNDCENSKAEAREGLARFLAAALPIFRNDAAAAGLEATASALDQAMSAIKIDVPASAAD